MRITYPIRWEDFRALQPPLAIRAGRDAGFRALVFICGLLVLLGLYLAIESGLEVGGFVIALAILAVVAAYWFDNRSVLKAKQKYENNIATLFERIHCREARTFEANEDGFRVSCKCGSVTRPWSELIQFSENPTHFLLRTKMDGQTIPKSAFSAQSEITEFRALAAAKLNRDQPLISPHLEFVCRREDFRNARMLHILKAGGWRLWLKRFLLGAWGIWALAYFCAKVPGNYIAAVAVLALVLLAFYLSKAASARAGRTHRAPMAVIAGSGMHDLFPIAAEVRAKTPYGEARMYPCTAAGREFLFLPRHGPDHSMPPHRINFKANLRALKDAGVERVIATSAVGSISDKLPVGGLGLLDQFIDLSKRHLTFFDSRPVHVDMTRPYDPELQDHRQAAAPSASG